MSQPLFAKMALIGLGLIGSSLAWAARSRGLAGEIVGAARSEATRQKALELGFVDRGDASDGLDFDDDLTFDQ